MSEEKSRVMYGKDDMTLSINDRRPGSGDGQKTEDWHADWVGQAGCRRADLLCRSVSKERRVDCGQAERSACKEG